MSTQPTAIERYAALRRLGSIYLPAGSESTIARLRACAKRDGLRVVAARPSGAGMGASQRRNRPFEVSLTDPLGTTVVAPDFDLD